MLPGLTLHHAPTLYTTLPSLNLFLPGRKPMPSILLPTTMGPLRKFQSLVGLLICLILFVPAAPTEVVLLTWTSPLPLIEAVWHPTPMLSICPQWARSSTSWPKVKKRVYSAPGVFRLFLVWTPSDVSDRHECAVRTRGAKSVFHSCEDWEAAIDTYQTAYRRRLVHSWGQAIPAKQMLLPLQNICYT